MKEKKPCELCNSLTTMYCELDQANLCSDCHSRVHGTNFLFAKHLRDLLCRSCQSPTLWNASGPRLTSTVHVHSGPVKNRKPIFNFSSVHPFTLLSTVIPHFVIVVILFFFIFVSFLLSMLMRRSKRNRSHRIWW